MRERYRFNFGRQNRCDGGINIEKGLMSIDCSRCKGKMELSYPECFIGVSEKIIPGYQGSIVLMGKRHRHYEGSIVETITTHSHILNEIKRLPNGRSIKKLRNLSLMIEKEFKMDPAIIIEHKDHYLDQIRKAVKEKKPAESDRFLTIVESISKMIRKLDRDVKRME